MSLMNATSNGEIFLQNDFLALGINSAGTLGSKTNAPTNFSTNTANGYLRIGLFADVDGFGTGKATTLRDAILPGTPIESFSVGYKLGGKTYEATNSGLNVSYEIKGTSTNTSTASAAQASWKGATTEKLAVDQVLTLTADGKFIRVDITLTNKSSESMTDLHYLRSIDPDVGSSFSTYNKVVEQGAGKALITAASSSNGSPFFLYADDSRAVVSAYGFEVESPFDPKVLTGQAKGYAAASDVSLNLNFDVGTLAAGASQKFTFYMGITNDLTGTIAQIDKAADGDTTPLPVNAAPDAINDAFTVETGKSSTGNVLTNDKDVDSNALTASLVTGPKNGTLVLKADGSYTYTAKAGFTGTDSFVYAASDGSLSDQATVSVTVKAAPNSAPVALGDSLTLLGGTSGTGNVLTNDNDPQGSSLTASLVTGPKNGTLVLKADGSYTYTPKDGFSGADSFVYAASDSLLKSNATVSLTVTAPAPPPPPPPPVNTAPHANADSATVQAGQVVTGTVLANDNDPEGSTLSASLVSGPKNGVLVLKTDGSYTYTANSGFSGTDSFVYAASDGALKDQAAVSITVTAPPPPPPPPPSSENGLLTKAGTVDMSGADSNTFTGAAHHNAFYVDATTKTGYDTITNFGRNDILVLNSQIYDSNKDGFISFKNGKLDVDGSAGSDVVVLKGVSTLRYMGDVDGLSVYANNAGKPNGAIESKIGDNTLKGDVGDKAKQVFFFDTALDLDLGNDKITNFGSRDVIVTTTALLDSDGNGVINFGSSGHVSLTGGLGALDDLGASGEGGTVAITNTAGAAVAGLEFDGAVTSGGLTYFVYSAIGSAVGVEAVGI